MPRLVEERQNDISAQAQVAILAEALSRLQVVAAGVESVDGVNVTFVVQTVDGEVTNIKEFDFGTCEEPA